MVLRAGYLVVASKIQESATAMCHEDIRTRLSDALNDAFRGTGNWCYVVAVFGDDKAGDLVYSCSSDLKKAAYTMSPGKTTIDTATAVDVQPLTTYEVESVAATEAGARHSKRDVMQLQTIHDASAALGANCSMAESHRKSGSLNETGPLKLVEAFGAFLEEIPIREADAIRTNYPIRIINPGTGSTAHYSADVLKREAGKFKPGTLMFWNHPTAAEEAARPEGNLDNLAAITTSQGVWKEDGPKGPGIYAEAKVMADYAEKVQERAPHIGLSIRAGGERDGNKLVEGKPVLKEFSYIESVDYVTKAGRGGLALAEAARDAGVLPIPIEEVSEMDAAELKALREAQAVLAADNKRLLERATRGDARELAATILAPLSLEEASKARVIARMLDRELPLKDGTLDAAQFTEAVNLEAKSEGQYAASLLKSGQVRGMGVAAPNVEAEKPEAIAAREAADESSRKKRVNIYADLMGGNIKAAEAALGYKGAA